MGVCETPEHTTFDLFHSCQTRNLGHARFPAESGTESG